MSLSSQPGLVDLGTGTNRTTAPDGVPDIINLSSDDFVAVALLKAGNSAGTPLDQNDGFAGRIGTQAVFYGSYASVWAVTSVQFFPVITEFSGTFAEVGALTAFLDANGAGNYQLDISYRNQFANTAGHGNVYLLMEVTQSHQAPEPGVLALVVSGLLTLRRFRSGRTS